jgi:hypothetical protein
MVGWTAGCAERYLSGAGSAGRNSTVVRQHGRRPSTPSRGPADRGDCAPLSAPVGAGGRDSLGHSWTSHGGIVRAARVLRGDVREPVHRCHHDRSVTTFLLYTGAPSPDDLTVVL